TVATPEPVTVAPAVAAADEPTPVLPAARAAGPSLGRGVTMAGVTGSRLCTGSNAPGDRLVATLSSDVTGADGALLPAGTGVVLEVARVGGDGTVELIARGVSLRGTYTPIVADVAVGEAAMEKRTVEGTGDSKGKAIKGAIAGAILGQILGRDTRSTVIGAAGGAAAGAAAGQMTKKHETCLPAGAPVTITLRDAVTL
ncbi:glycine zipper 2TM domain-containing protein, partial [Roseisolibacter sp. H3M3-2]|uniref:glycine zipper 2TM domain-containing protein n=1 Tax=Roseisolibacter sp. H3M3-2 TaxID=3031323 RepID=UPI0023DB2DA0